VLLALSGGVDSIVLFNIVNKLSSIHHFEIGVAHVNHGIHKDADLTEEFCRSESEENNCKYYSVKLEKPHKKQSIEAWARKERYNYLTDISVKHRYHWIFTAHHEDDQVETMFLRKYQKQNNWISYVGIREELGKIKRPIISEKRIDILRYANENYLNWIEDPTNNNQTYLRNKVRHSLLPDSIQSNPKIRQELLELNRSAIDKLLELKEETKNVEKSVFVEEGKNQDSFTLKIENYCNLSFDVKKFLLQSICQKIFNNFQLELSQDNWNTFFQFIDKSKTGKIFRLSNNLSCLMDRTKFTIFVNNCIKLPKLSLSMNETNEWGDCRIIIKTVNNYSKSTDKSSMILPSTLKLYVRVWEVGDYIISYNTKKKVKLSNLFINHKLSLLEKQKYPIIVDGKNEVLWVPGLLHAEVKGLSKSKQLKEIRWEEN